MSPRSEPRELSEDGWELPPWLWLLMPLGLWLLPYGMAYWSPDSYQRYIRSEYGLIENLTAVFLLVAVILGAAGARRARALSALGVRRWLLLMTIGCFFFLGEEISWGQHLAGWSTPEAWAGSNDQAETNLHNLHWTRGLLDQVPRSLLSLAAVLGGIVAPLVLRWTRRGRRATPKLSFWIWPTLVATPAAVLATIANLPKKVAAWSGSELPRWLTSGGGERKECFLALFLMLYLASLWARMGREQPADSAPEVRA